MGDEEKATEYINLKVAEVNIFAEVNYYGSVVQFKMKKGMRIENFWKFEIFKVKKVHRLKPSRCVFSKISHFLE